MVRTDKILDVKGLVSPRPEMLTEKTLASMKDGQILTVVTTDGSARKKLPQVCEGMGCRILDLTEDRGRLSFRILKQGAAGE